MVQTALTILIGLAALVYLLRRWWPTWRSLWRPASPGSACASTQARAGVVVGTPAAACGQGCGQCSGGTTVPARDHRDQPVRILRKGQA
jgi:hypothetical protein